MDTRKPIHLNYPTFEKAVKKSTILVDFWAPWCAPCKAQDPVLEELAGEWDGKVLVGKVNVDDNRILAEKYGVFNIPTLILFQNGEKKQHLTGVQSKERLVNIIQKHL